MSYANTPLENTGLPVVGRTYASKEKRSLGKLATVLEPVPTHHGFVSLRWHESGRKTRMRMWYFWDRFIPHTESGNG